MVLCYLLPTDASQRRFQSPKQIQARIATASSDCNKGSDRSDLPELFN